MIWISRDRNPTWSKLNGGYVNFPTAGLKNNWDQCWKHWQDSPSVLLSTPQFPALQGQTESLISRRFALHQPHIHSTLLCHLSESESHSVLSDSLRPHGLYGPWNSPGQNTGVGSGSLLQPIFLTQESNQGLLPWRWILYQLNYQERPEGDPSKNSGWMSWGHVPTLVGHHDGQLPIRSSRLEYARRERCCVDNHTAPSPKDIHVLVLGTATVLCGK